MNFPFIKIPAIAVVLTDREVLSLKKEELSGADLIELRVDMFERIENIEDVFKLAKSKFNLPILTTVRNPLEGGEREFTERIEIYNKVLPYSDLADVEILSKDFISIKELIRQQNKLIIASYHRFDLTPSVEELTEVYEKGRSLEADIIKIATMVNDTSDLENLFLFILRYRKNPIIVIGMGDMGRPSRVLMPCFGSLITYAGVKTKSAPGQIYLKDMVSIFRILGLR